MERRPRKEARQGAGAGSGEEMTQGKKWGAQYARGMAAAPPHRGLLHAFHGTSTANLASILREGLRSPYLGDRRDLAWYYAEEAVGELGGRPVILAVSVQDVERLRHDDNAMEEPVMADDDERDAELERAGDEHPEWLHGETIYVPAEEWEYSWRGVGSIWYDGVLPPDAIAVAEQAGRPRA